MKINKNGSMMLTVALVAVGMVSMAGLAHASVTTTYGNVPGYASPFGGSGIDSSQSQVVTSTSVSGPDGLQPMNDTVTTAMDVTGRGSSAPTPVSEGNGTYNAALGGSGGDALWNFDYFITSAKGDLADYTATLTITSVGTGLSEEFNPMLGILGNAGTPGTAAGNSENLGFSFLAPGINFNNNANNTYLVDLDVSLDGQCVLNNDIIVNAGTGIAPVPEPTTIAAGALMLLPFGIGALRSVRKQQA